MAVRLNHNSIIPAFQFISSVSSVPSVVKAFLDILNPAFPGPIRKKEFIQKGFSGDCEDIAVFMMGTLKRMGYSDRIRILTVQAVFEDHALLRVEMPEGGWKVYDVVPRRVPSLEMTQLKPLVEFDERAMFWYPSQTETNSHPKKPNSFMAGRADRPPVPPASPASKSASPNGEAVR